MKKMTYIASALLLACLALLLVSPLSAAAATSQTTASSNSISAPITGSASNGDTFNGTFTVTRFVSQNNQLFAVGTVSGVLKNASGGTIGNVTNVPAALPVTAASATCPILSLTLGPLHLNLLGLVVDLNQVVLNITAQSGPGNLLGNLLCAVAGLLNGGTPLSGLAGILNQILAAL